MSPPLDTNVIIRYVAGDSPHLALRARAFLKRVEAGAETVHLTEGVLLEAVQVLSSKVLYNLPRATVAHALTTIIRLRGVRMTNKARYTRALELYATTATLDFVDAMLVAYAEREAAATIISFDHDFDRIPGVMRIEPS